MSEHNGHDPLSEDRLWEFAKRIDLRNLPLREVNQDDEMIREVLQDNHSATHPLPNFLMLANGNDASQLSASESLKQSIWPIVSTRYSILLPLVVAWLIGLAMGGMLSLFLNRPERVPIYLEPSQHEEASSKYDRSTLIKTLKDYENVLSHRGEDGQVASIFNTFAETTELSSEERAAFGVIIKELEKSLAKPSEGGPR